MYGSLSEHAALSHVAQRQTEYECAARQRRLVREIKNARRHERDRAAVPDPSSGRHRAAA